MKSISQALTVESVLDYMLKNVVDSAESKHPEMLSSLVANTNFQEMEINLLEEQPKSSEDVYKFWLKGIDLVDLDAEKIKKNDFVMKLAGIIEASEHPFFSNLLVRIIAEINSVDVKWLLQQEKIGELLNQQVVFNFLAAFSQFVIEKKNQGIENKQLEENKNILLDFYNRESKAKEEQTRNMTAQSFYLTQAAVLDTFLKAQFLLNDLGNSEKGKLDILPESIIHMIQAGWSYEMSIAGQTEQGAPWFMQSLVPVCFSLLMSICKILKESKAAAIGNGPNISFNVKLVNDEVKIIYVPALAVELFYQILNQVFLGPAILDKQEEFRKRIDKAKKPSEYFNVIKDYCLPENMLHADIVSSIAKKEFFLMPIFSSDEFIGAREKIEQNFIDLVKSEIEAGILKNKANFQEDEQLLAKIVIDALSVLNIENFDQTYQLINDETKKFAEARIGKGWKQLLADDSCKKLTQYISQLTAMPSQYDIETICVCLLEKKYDNLKKLSNPIIGNILFEEFSKDTFRQANDFDGSKLIVVVKESLLGKNFQKLKAIKSEGVRTVIERALATAYPQLADSNDIAKLAQSFLQLDLTVAANIKDEKLKRLMFDFLTKVIAKFKENNAADLQTPMSLKAALFLVNAMPDRLLANMVKKNIKKTGYASEELTKLFEDLANLSGEGLLNTFNLILNSEGFKSQPKLQKFFGNALKDTGSKLCADLQGYLANPLLFLDKMLDAIKQSVSVSQKESEALAKWKSFAADLAVLLQSREPAEVFAKLWQKSDFKAILENYINYKTRWYKVDLYVQRLVRYLEKNTVLNSQVLNEVGRYIALMQRAIKGAILNYLDSKQILKIQEISKRLSAFIESENPANQELEKTVQELAQVGYYPALDNQVNTFVTLINYCRYSMDILEQDYKDIIDRCTFYLIGNLAGPAAFAARYFGKAHQVKFPLTTEMSSMQRYIQMQAEMAVNVELWSKREKKDLPLADILKGAINSVTHLELHSFDHNSKEYQVLMESCSIKEKSQILSEAQKTEETTGKINKEIVNNYIGVNLSVIKDKQAKIGKNIVKKMYDSVTGKTGEMQDNELATIGLKEQLQLLLDVAVYTGEVEVADNIIRKILVMVIEKVKHFEYKDASYIFDYVFKKQSAIRFELDSLRKAIDDFDKDQGRAIKKILKKKAGFFDLANCAIKGFNPIIYALKNNKLAAAYFILELCKQSQLLVLYNLMSDPGVRKNRGFSEKLEEILVNNYHLPQSDVKSNKLQHSPANVTEGPSAKMVIPKMLDGRVDVTTDSIKALIETDKKEFHDYFKKNFFERSLAARETSDNDSSNNIIIKIFKAVYEANSNLYLGSYFSLWKQFANEYAEIWPIFSQLIAENLILPYEKQAEEYAAQNSPVTPTQTKAKKKTLRTIDKDNSTSMEQLSSVEPDSPNKNLDESLRLRHKSSKKYLSSNKHANYGYVPEHYNSYLLKFPGFCNPINLLRDIFAGKRTPDFLQKALELIQIEHEPMFIFRFKEYLKTEQKEESRQVYEQLILLASPLLTSNEIQAKAERVLESIKLEVRKDASLYPQYVLNSEKISEKKLRKWRGGQPKKDQIENLQGEISNNNNSGANYEKSFLGNVNVLGSQDGKAEVNLISPVRREGSELKFTH